MAVTAAVNGRSSIEHAQSQRWSKLHMSLEAPVALPWRSIACIWIQCACTMSWPGCVAAPRSGGTEQDLAARLESAIANDDRGPDRRHRLRGHTERAGRCQRQPGCALARQPQRPARDAAIHKHFHNGRIETLRSGRWPGRRRAERSTSSSAGLGLDAGDAGVIEGHIARARRG